MTYIASENLKMALQTAQKLNRPLLLTGEPGTGKTKFAEYILTTENEITYSELRKFTTKSTSISQDLFYRFDSIAYFASKQNNEGKPITSFIYLTALGKAICDALSKEQSENILKESALFKNCKPEDQVDFLNEFTKQISIEPINSIVLIDEIDKATRDFPNDILDEIDDGYRFEIKELGVKFSLNKKDSILVIITSNYERNLPDPFLRRCVYYNIEFPSKVELLNIVCKKYFPDFFKDSKMFENFEDVPKECDNEKLELIKLRMNEIQQLIDAGMQKKPSTSEILDFFLCTTGNDLKQKININNKNIFCLVKRKEDLNIVKSLS